VPFIEVKVIRGVFSREEKSQIVGKVTDAFAHIKGDEFTAGTRVVVNELDDVNRGEGGTVLEAESVP
jgi:phenylpyruvate tautomerase PptA (4-oxalocrotonate tautomerase family)